MRITSEPTSGKPFWTMKQLMITLAFTIVGCAANLTSILPSQEILLPEFVYKDVPGTIVIQDQIEITGTYDNNRSFGSSGVEIKEDRTFRRWKQGLWDSSKGTNYQNANWIFQDGILTLNYGKPASKKIQQKIFDVVSFEDRIFLVPINERESFIAIVLKYQNTEASTDQLLISFELLVGSFLSKTRQN